MSPKRLVALVSVVASVALGCGGGGGGGNRAASAPTFTVTYQGNASTGGTAPIDSNTYTSGQAVPVLGNTGSLARTGYSFAGWNTRANGTGTRYTQGQTFAMGGADVTLYASWTTVPTLTVSYDGNGSTSGALPVDSTPYTEGQAVTVLGSAPVPVRAGYSFAGWNTRADGTGTSYTPGQTFSIGASDVVLYATWSAPSPTYRVTYSGNGNTGGTVPVDPTLYNPGQPVVVLGNTGGLDRTGYAFRGWNTRADGTGSPYLEGETFPIDPPSDVVLYASWSPVTPIPTFRVTYSGSGSTGGAVPVDSIQYTAGQTVTVLGNTGGLSRTGFFFAAWNTRADGTGTTYTPGQTFSIGLGDVAFYAIWSTVAPTYHVIYSGNDNTGGSAPADSSTYTLGQSVTTLGNTGGLVRTHYSFAGWNTRSDGGGTTYAPGQTFSIGAGDVVFYALWSPLPTYTVTYDANGASGGLVPYDDHRYYPGDQATAYTRVDQNIWKAQDGFYWTFAGWNTAANGSGAMYTIGQKFTMGSANVTLYAQWSAMRVAGPAGGVIFYDKGSSSGGWRYLEAAPQEENNYDPVPWYNGTYLQTGATGTGLGAGEANTAAIAGAQGDGKYAARLCDVRVSGGFGDWYLPSRDELTLLFNNLADFGLVSGLNWNYAYWSSSEYSTVDAWTKNFHTDKSQAARVHCIRSF